MKRSSRAGARRTLLACELGLAGVSVLVLERDAAAASPWKEPGLGLRGLNSAAIEALSRWFGERRLTALEAKSKGPKHG